MAERQAGAGSGADESSTSGERQSLYTRRMPGGGCVRVELLVSDPADVSNERLRGRVVIEPMLAAPAPAMIVQEVEGEDANAVVAELFRIARDNAAIARRVLRQQRAD